jgi:hypothetical protein
MKESSKICETKEGVYPKEQIVKMVVAHLND